jgi:peptide/nickel transport system permease protein
MPGDPLSIMSKEVKSSPETRASMERLYGLDKPIAEQYINYVKSMITFDFGMSFNYRMPVAEVLSDKIKNSVVLALWATPLGIAIGVVMGIVAAAFRGKKADSIITTSSMVIYAIPSFWLAMILMLYLGVKFKLVPISGMTNPGMTFATYFDYLKNLAWHMITPVVSYALATFGSYFLIMRSSMLDVFAEDFVLTARAKGLSRRKVITRHVVPNAMLPITTVIITSIALMFTGFFSIEILFSWPGVGRMMVEAVTKQDYPLMQAINFLIAVAVVITNLLVDILYGYLDPRVRVE